MSTTIVIPGIPFAQPRGKAARWQSKDGRSGVSVRDPKEARDWKAKAAAIMAAQVPAAPLFPEGEAVGMEIIAIFPCPKSAHRKRAPVSAKWYVSNKRHDVDNLAKAVMDAATGILFADDGQVVTARVSKVIASQGSAPLTRVRVWRANPANALLNYESAHA